MKLKNFFLILGKKIFNLNWIYLHKIFVSMYSIPYTRVQTQHNKMTKNPYLVLTIN